MTTKPKLTKAQESALKCLAFEGTQTWGKSWAPAAMLVGMGLANTKARGNSTRWYTITAAGLAHPAVTTTR